MCLIRKSLDQRQVVTVDLIQKLKGAAGSDIAVSSDFDLNPEFKLPANRKLRPAGVLVPLVERDNAINVILTKRSSALKHHPGQISFPGGKVEETDKDVVSAALREAHEEIGLNPVKVDVLANLSPHETVTNFSVTPVLAHVRADFQPVLQQDEVAEMFEVPITHLLKPENYSVQYRIWQGQKRYFYTVPFGPYYIWGATARILRRMADIVA